MGTSDSAQSWSTTVKPPRSNSTSGPNSNSVSNVSNVKPTRRRTTLEVVILLKKVKPAYHVTGTFFGDDAEDQSITRAQVMKEVRNGNQEEDQDYEGDVDGDAGINEDDEMDHSDDHDISPARQDRTGLIETLACNPLGRYKKKENEGYPAQLQGEITAVHRAESIDLDLDSPSSCITSSSSDSDDDDLCSIDTADLTGDLGGRGNLGWGENRDKVGNDDEEDSESGRISHVSCSVDESSDEDEVDQQRHRSPAPSPPVHAPPPIVQGTSPNVQRPVNVLDSPRSSAARTLDIDIKLEEGDSKDVINEMMSLQTQISLSKSIVLPQPSSPIDPLPTSTSPSQQTADAPKARKYARLRLEVSLPHPSSRKKTASAPKEHSTNINVNECSQPSQLDEGNKSLEKGWNDGWPGQWEPAAQTVTTASNLIIGVEGMQFDTLRNDEASQDKVESETSLEKEGKDGLDVPMEVDGYRLPLTTPTLPTLPSDNRQTYPTTKTAYTQNHHEQFAPSNSSSSSITTTPSSELDAESTFAAGNIVQADHIAPHPDLRIPTSSARASSSAQTGSATSARFLALLFEVASNSHPHSEAEVDTAAPKFDPESGESNDTINLKDSINNKHEHERVLKRKVASLMDVDGGEDGASEGRSGNDFTHASSSAQTGYGQSTSRPGYGMRGRSLGREQDQVQPEAESMEKDNCATIKVEDVKEVEVKDEDVKMEVETDIKWKGKGKQVAASDSSSIDGRASSLGVKVEAGETATQPKVMEQMDFEGNEKTSGSLVDVAPIIRSIPRRHVVPAIAPTTGIMPPDVLPVDKGELRNAIAPDRIQADATTSTPQAVNPRMAATPQTNHPLQRKVGPPTAGSIRIDSFLAQNDYDARGRVIIEPQRNGQQRNLAPDLVLAYPPIAVVGHLPTFEVIENIYIYLQLAPLVPSRIRLNDINGPFFHGNDLWNRVLHPNMKQVLSDQNVVYPAMNINPYPPEAVFIRFQIDQWRTQASLAPYKACILGGSASDNQAMKSLLNRSIGGQLPLDYPSSLLQVLASKLDAVGRMGMGVEVSPCRIMSTTCLEIGNMGTVITTAEFDGLLRHCSTSPSTEMMAGWFICQGKVSTYSYTFETRSLRVYSTGRVIGPRFHGYVQVLLDSLTNILDLPEYDIDVELLHLAPLAQPQEEGPIAIAILELLLLDKIPHRCLLDMHTTEDRLAAWIPQVRLQHAQYLLDDQAAFKLLDRRLRALRRMMDDHA